MKILLVLVLVMFCSARAQEYAAGVKVSTLGITLEGIRSFGDDFNARLGISYFSYNYKGGGGTTEDYFYDAKLKLFSVSALADYFPFNNWLRVTGGVIINLNDTKAVLTPSKTYIVGGDYYTPEKLGNMDAVIKMNKVMPYLGLGIGNPLSGKSHFKFSMDIGAAYQGKPQADLSCQGLLEPSAAPDQEQKISDNLSWFQFYPVISFGLVYKF